MDKIEDLDFLFPVKRGEGSDTLGTDLDAEDDEVEEEIFEEGAGLLFTVDLGTRIFCLAFKVEVFLVLYPSLQ